MTNPWKSVIAIMSIEQNFANLSQLMINIKYLLTNLIFLLLQTSSKL